eukprot:TRINITY_DN1993_c0_g1_i1.p1 TRINITY_DN1993_c0_g1~~TRINITY_DN1993_c0_g1_i1.p1  ORF type:complete len:302 (+),score=71.87 TRINITY_DN1993_c0_g1_i1:59-964(+)
MQCRRRLEKTTMGEKDGEKKGDEKKGDGGKKDDGRITVVMTVDMHCDGCAKKIKNSVKGFEGVDEVKADFNSNKLTVVGKVDPVKLRERVEKKTKKKVDLVSPIPKKDKEGGGGGGGGDKKGDEKAEKKKDDKKPKEPPVTSVVLKIRLHCEGCIQKIKRAILKVKGVQNVSFDPQKDLVMIRGTMDVKALPDNLKDKLKRSVEIVPQKKDDGGGDKKEKEKDGGEKKKDGGGGGGEKKEKEKAAGGEGKKEDGGKVEGNKMEYSGYGYGLGYSYGNGYATQYVHAPQIFSDENPNACSVM